jgi:hypothetical protein
VQKGCNATAAGWSERLLRFKNFSRKVLFVARNFVFSARLRVCYFDLCFSRLFFLLILVEGVLVCGRNKEGAINAQYVLTYPPLGDHDALDPQTVAFVGLQAGDNEAQLRILLAQPSNALMDASFALLQTIANYYGIPAPNAAALPASVNRIYRSVFIDA